MTRQQAIDFGIDRLGLFGGQMDEFIKVSLDALKEQRPKGHWIEQIDHEENCRTLICSNCDRPALHDGDSIWKHKFCPHCGADMRDNEVES